MKRLAGLDLRTLEVFAAVCETRSMTLAARRLQMTQPNVSHAIKQLESAMGVALIDRQRRPLTATSAGHWLAGYATQILQEVQQIPIAIRHLDRGLALRLRIGLVDTLADPFVSVMVKRLHSSIHYLAISAGLASVLRRGLIEHSLDLIITNDPMDDVDGIVRHAVLTEPYVVVVPRALSIEAPNLDLGRLAKEVPLIRWSAQSHIGADIERQLRRMRVEIPRRFEFDAGSTILSMVASGIGWAVMTPLSIYEIKPMLSRLRMLTFPGPAFTRRLAPFARVGEIQTPAERIAIIARQILRDRYVPEMLKVAPWLAGAVKVAD